MLDIHVYSIILGAELYGCLFEFWVEEGFKIFLSSGAGLSSRLS